MEERAATQGLISTSALVKTATLGSTVNEVSPSCCSLASHTLKQQLKSDSACRLWLKISKQSGQVSQNWLITDCFVLCALYGWAYLKW